MAFNRINSLQLRSADSAAFDGTYQPLSPGIDEACYLLRIINDSDKDIFISYDGITNNDFIRSGETLDLSAAANPFYQSHTAVFAKGMPVWVLGTVAGTGLIYLSGYYQPLS